jgi:hypothetical protein
MLAIMYSKPISVALQSKPSFCGHAIAGVVVSNPAEGMDVLLLCLFCVVWLAVAAPC